VARALCRRCERIILILPEPAPDDLHDLVVYFNRLSDLLFALAWSLDVRERIRLIVKELFPQVPKGDAPCP
jgi:cob(I)alamin adenosyltransferase